MENFYKYLPVSKEDERWGLHILNTGFTHIEEAISYPSKKHPSPYFFNFTTGRILQEYQLIYITRGEGFFESATAGKKTIRAGDAILLFPGERHNYKPDKSTGWDEYWIGFNGYIFTQQVLNNFFNPDDPVFKLGLEYEIIRIFDSIIELAKEEKPAYQQIISGMLLHLLGIVYSRKRQRSVPEKDKMNFLVNKAISCFRETMTEHVSPESVASQLGISYSLFRKIFKSHTGLAPGQYLIQLRISKAKQLLAGSEKPIKEIAYELGFDSALYFSRVFNQKTGISPQRFRDQ